MPPMGWSHGRSLECKHGSGVWDLAMLLLQHGAALLVLAPVSLDMCHLCIVTVYSLMEGLPIMVVFFGTKHEQKKVHASH